MALIPASTKNDALLFIIMLLPGPTVCWQSASADADGVMLQAATALFMFFYSFPLDKMATISQTTHINAFL